MKMTLPKCGKELFILEDGVIVEDKKLNTNYCKAKCLAEIRWTEIS